MDTFIYKIATRDQWNAAQAAGIFRGAPIDLDDGYIHFSTAAQARETASKHFKGQSDLLILTVATAALGTALKYEPSRGGQLFPHLYAPLAIEAVQKVDPLPLASDGHHIFPEHMDAT
ncbi:MAG: DUF952 domain-containing protein [Pseudomonadota bacterium]